MTSLALLIVRLIVGLGMASHGSQKLFKWFGGSGPHGMAQYFAKLRFPVPLAFAILAGTGELVGGVLLAAGWLGAIGPALIISVMIVATFSEHLPHGFYNYNGGYELPAMYAMAALAVAFSGSGVYALDSLAPISILAGPLAAWIAIAAGVVLAFITLECRLPAAAQQQTAAH